MAMDIGTSAPARTAVEVDTEDIPKFSGEIATNAPLRPTDGLPFASLPSGFTQHGPALLFVGCHGGAGTTTLARLIKNGHDGGRYWPVPAVGNVSVVLVARTHADGLRRAQAAGRQWADRRIPESIRPIGLAAVADTPGKLPKPLRHLLDLISGGLPNLWCLPWVEGLRLGEPARQISFPSAYSDMAADLHRITSGANHA
jgi:hypothetical protein